MRYIKNLARAVQSLGPSEERGYAMWVGYDIAGVDDDLSAIGLLRADDFDEEELAKRGVTSFTRVEPDDGALYAKLGLERKR
ncbi:MAG TPA: hypothetical protein VF698_00260 [Thermoanaerobaculia bacterium]|jgi:hypothetical protein